MTLMNHKAGEKCLLEVSRILANLELPFFLMQGTALGAYRDKGFVPTERDIDLGVMYEDMAKLDIGDVLRWFVAHGFDIECFTMPFEHPRTIVLFKEYAGKLAKVDIVSWHIAPDDKRRFNCCPIRNYIHKPYAIVHDRKLLENQRSIELFGRKFNIPSDIETYLLREYGEQWKTPLDDHVSRTRVYDFLVKEKIDSGYLSHAKHRTG